MKKVRWLLAAVAALLVAQAIPIPRTNPPVERDVEAPADVKAILRRACYDCHSHETVWGWHTRIAPISWLVAYDVIEGRDELNFSRWGKNRKAEQLPREIAKEIQEGDMPPFIYVIGHPEAKLTEADKALLVRWAGTLPAGGGP